MQACTHQFPWWEPSPSRPTRAQPACAPDIVLEQDHPSLPQLGAESAWVEVDIDHLRDRWQMADRLDPFHVRSEHTQCAAEPPSGLGCLYCFSVSYLKIQIHAMRAKFHIVFSIGISDQNALLVQAEHSKLRARPEACTLGICKYTRRLGVAA